MRSRILSGLAAGTLAGLVMALAMMGYMAYRGRSLWRMPDLIAVMWMGEEVADGRLGWATLVGFATHVATSAVMGIVAVPFIDGLSRWRTVLVASAYAIASYPVAFSAVITWANPLMIERTELVPMTVAHGIFGVVLGLAYVGLRRVPRPARKHDRQED